MQFRGFSSIHIPYLLLLLSKVKPIFILLKLRFVKFSLVSIYKLTNLSAGIEVHWFAFSLTENLKMEDYLYRETLNFQYLFNFQTRLIFLNKTFEIHTKHSLMQLGGFWTFSRRSKIFPNTSFHPLSAKFKVIWDCSSECSTKDKNRILSKTFILVYFILSSNLLRRLKHFE